MKPMTAIVLLAGLIQTAKADPVGAANARVPEPYADILVFRSAMHKRAFGSFEAVVPSGWSLDPDTGTYFPPSALLPPESKRMGYTTLRVVSTCAGTCSSKDWGSVIQAKVEEYKAKGYTTERDETPAAGERLLVSRHADKRILARFFSKPGASRYFVCEAEVDHTAQATEAAFEAACAGLVILGWD
jgi:hypothetical protein